MAGIPPISIYGLKKASRHAPTVIFYTGCYDAEHAGATNKSPRSDYGESRDRMINEFQVLDYDSRCNADRKTEKKKKDEAFDQTSWCWLTRQRNSSLY